MTSDTPLWARQVRLREEIPSKFMTYMDSFAVSQSELPLIISMPQHPNEDKVALDKLMYLYNDGLYLYEEMDDQSIRSSFVSFDDIYYIEHGKVLLYSWISIRGKGIENEIKLDFNTVMEPLFKEVIEQVRDFHKSKFQSTELFAAKPADMTSLEYKFQNYINDSSNIPVEPFGYVYQEEFQKSADESVYNHLTMLTQNELIFIKEIPDIKNSTKFCSVWIFIPIYKIDSLEIINYKDSTDISLEYKIGSLSQSLASFQPEAKDGLYELRNVFMQLKGHQKEI